MAASKRKRFQLTSLPLEERPRIAGYIKKLGGTLIDTQIFTKQATHVICGKANRGEKYLGGCALGKWVLQKQFVEDSFKQGSWLDEEEYEWTSNVLDAGVPKELLLLHDAPRKWRLALENTKTGAFSSWNAIVYMRDNKLKKAYERLLEAGGATIVKKKISFQDSSTLPIELSHVFVEAKLKPDVEHLESKGILVHSPDYIPEYIIKGPKETVISANVIKNNKLANYKLPRIAEIKKTGNFGALPGKENFVKSKEFTGKRGVKRPSTECDFCTAKRQKTMTMNGLPPFVHINSTTDVQKARPLTFPEYISNILESCMEEECMHLGMESVAASLSSNQVPTSKWVHIIMNYFLLNASSEHQAFQSYNLLQNIVEVHPPLSCRSLYLEALEEPICEGSQNIEKTTPWEFVSKVIRNCLRKQECEEMERMQSNAILLLKFLDTLFKRDGCNAGQSSSILTRILWPTASDSACQSNREMKELVALCCEAVKLAVCDDTQLSACHVLLDWVSMAATLKKRDDVSGQACESLAQQMFIEMSKTDSYEANKLLLQGCHSSWLKMRILELILENFDKRLIPQEYKQLLNKSLKLNKIVFCYFFLLPNTKGTEKASGVVENKMARRIRRNGKGETPLHLACIRNDALKVEEILKQNDLDVNVADNAGWTALHEACNRGHVQCVKKILQYHERTNKVDFLASPDDGVTVLHDAVVTNHLSVVKLLVQAGGLDLLQAKTSLGMTALQLAPTNDIAQFIKSELTKLVSTQNRESMLRPSEEAYHKILSRNKRKYYIALEECEKYLFYISLLVQVYIREHTVVSSSINGTKFCSNCVVDVGCMERFHQHLSNLEEHVELLSGKQNLSHLSQLYITSMKLCTSRVI